MVLRKGKVEIGNSGARRKMNLSVAFLFRSRRGEKHWLNTMRMQTRFGSLNRRGNGRLSEFFTNSLGVECRWS